MDIVINETEERLWPLPLWIVCTLLLNLVLLTGVALATWKEAPDCPRSRRVEGILSWGILPLLMVLMVVGWALLITLCFGTVVTTDICMSGSAAQGGGSPEATVQKVLLAQGFTPGEITFDMIKDYIEVCATESGFFEWLSLKLSLTILAVSVDC
jgi:hypothetical protein